MTNQASHPHKLTSKLQFSNFCPHPFNKQQDDEKTANARLIYQNGP
jgi:hypothetical protein